MTQAKESGLTPQLQLETNRIFEGFLIGTSLIFTIGIATILINNLISSQ